VIPVRMCHVTSSLPSTVSVTRLSISLQWEMVGGCRPLETLVWEEILRDVLQSVEHTLAQQGKSRLAIPHAFNQKEQEPWDFPRLLLSNGQV
jgi:hypothetical protein